MRVYPSPGLIVRDPVKRDALPPEGRDVDDGDFYWLRRVACKDATLEKPVAAAVTPEATPAVVPTIIDPKATKTTPSDGSAS
jgi:hypothetical protein